MSLVGASLPSVDLDFDEEAAYKRRLGLAEQIYDDLEGDAETAAALGAMLAQSDDGHGFVPVALPPIRPPPYSISEAYRIAAPYSNSESNLLGFGRNGTSPRGVHFSASVPDLLQNAAGEGLRTSRPKKGPLSWFSKVADTANDFKIKARNLMSKRQVDDGLEGIPKIVSRRPSLTFEVDPVASPASPSPPSVLRSDPHGSPSSPLSVAMRARSPSSSLFIVNPDQGDVLSESSRGVPSRALRSYGRKTLAGEEDPAYMAHRSTTTFTTMSSGLAVSLDQLSAHAVSLEQRSARAMSPEQRPAHAISPELMPTPYELYYEGHKPVPVAESSDRDDGSSPALDQIVKELFEHESKHKDEGTTDARERKKCERCRKLKLLIEFLLTMGN